jgi:hypothetical protein
MDVAHVDGGAAASGITPCTPVRSNALPDPIEPTPASGYTLHRLRERWDLLAGRGRV